MARTKGTKKFEINEGMLDKISALAGLGLTVDQVGHLIDMPKSTFERYLRNDVRVANAMEAGRAKAITQVSKTAFDLARSGEHPGMTMFYLKCRAGWSEKIDIHTTGRTEVTFVTKIGGDGMIKVLENTKQELSSDDLEFDAEIVKDES